MLVLRNWANRTTPRMYPNDPEGSPQETKVVGEELWIRALSARGLSAYCERVSANQSATIWTHSVEINPEVDCEVFTAGSKTKIFCPANQWTKLSNTLNQSLSPWSFNREYAIRHNDATLKNKWIRTRYPMSNEGKQSSDLYVPPESVLTAKQLATLPPYGEFKEILPL